MDSVFEKTHIRARVEQHLCLVFSIETSNSSVFFPPPLKVHLHYWRSGSVILDN